MPRVATSPIHILLTLSLSALSLTLEQKTATKMTDNKLQDLTMMEVENEEVTTALL